MTGATESGRGPAERAKSQPYTQWTAKKKNGPNLNTKDENPITDTGTSPVRVTVTQGELDRDATGETESGSQSA